MIVNGIDIKKYSARLLKKDIQLTEIDNYVEWLDGSLLPLKLKEIKTFRDVKLEIAVKTDTFENSLMQCSNLLNQLKDCNVRFKDMEGLHRLYITSHEEVKFVRTRTIRLFVEFIGYYYKEEPEFTLEGREGSIFVPGNIKTPAIVEIIPKINLIDLSIKGLGEDITIKNLKANVPIIINGEDCTILESDKNKFNETDMWEFPYLVPGTNQISIDKDNVDIKIKYKSRWI